MLESEPEDRPILDWVEEASMESFPASDAPAWPESASRRQTGRPDAAA